MFYSIKVNIQPKNFEHPLSSTIIEGNRSKLFIKIPFFEGKKVTFLPSEELELVYYIGQFQYVFSCSYVNQGIKEIFEETKEEKETKKVLKETIPFYELSIMNVDFLKNKRKEKRELVEMDALVMDNKGLYYGKILDISTSGIGFRTSEPIPLKSTYEIHYVNENNLSVKTKGKIIWSKKGKEFMYYGFEFTK